MNTNKIKKYDIINMIRGVCNMNYITNAKDYSLYIASRYFNKYNKEISSIKLQKSLYFTFAYWSGFVGKSRLKESEQIINESPYLFEDEFQAWVYGPVIPSIYKEYKDGNIKNVDNNDLFKNNDFLEETINTLLDDIFEISDFKLVALSHDDESWIKNFNKDEERHNKVIKRDDIFLEYTEKAFN